MSKSEVRSQANVPFSWENKPGISKVTHQECPTAAGPCTLKLPPPPPWALDRVKSLGHHDLQIPLPPCLSQSSSRSSSFRKVPNLQDDPFWAAYKECTKSVSEGKLAGSNKKSGVFRARKSMSIFSCIHTCHVREDSLVRLSHLPLVTRRKLLEER